VDKGAYEVGKQPGRHSVMVIAKLNHQQPAGQCKQPSQAAE